MMRIPAALVLLMLAAVATAAAPPTAPADTPLGEIQRAVGRVEGEVKHINKNLGRLEQGQLTLGEKIDAVGENVASLQGGMTLAAWVIGLAGAGGIWANFFQNRKIARSPK